jgi:hypothetical protein
MSEGEYVEINGLKTYYEAQGEGEPLLRNGVAMAGPPTSRDR